MEQLRLDEGGGLGGGVRIPPSGKIKDKRTYGKHAGPDEARLHMVRVPSWETWAGSKVDYWNRRED